MRRCKRCQNPRLLSDYWPRRLVCRYCMNEYARKRYAKRKRPLNNQAQRRVKKKLTEEEKRERNHFYYMKYKLDGAQDRYDKTKQIKREALGFSSYEAYRMAQLPPKRRALTWMKRALRKRGVETPSVKEWEKVYNKRADFITACEIWEKNNYVDAWRPVLMINPNIDWRIMLIKFKGVRL